MKHRWKLSDLKGLKIVGEIPLPTETKKSRNNQFWVEVDGKRYFCRSVWEANYLYFLHWQKKQGLIFRYEKEPDVFWFEGIRRGVTNYLPDFKVWRTADPKDFYYVEVKGYMDRQSKTKIRRMAKYHPTVGLAVCDSKWFKANTPHLAGIVPGWITLKRK